MILKLYTYSEIQDLFNKADLNNNVVLTIDEFMIFLSKMIQLQKN
jgi:Ca2+-binding EF-hand superfamily protein